MDEKLQNIINKCKAVWGDHFDYSSVTEIIGDRKILVTCRTHGSWYVRWDVHTRLKSGCNQCRLEKLAETNVASRKTLSEFIELSNIVHNNKYDYSKTVYTGANNKIIVICPDHGEFTHLANEHKNGREGCKTCFSKKLSNAISFTQEEYFGKAKIIHGDRFEYSSPYNGMHKKISFRCIKHDHECTQIAQTHLASKDPCIKCEAETQSALQTKSTEQFVIDAKVVYGDMYDYSLTEYKNSKENILIRCKKHDFVFDVTPNSHLMGQGCPKCSRHASNKANKWLDSKGITIRERRVSGTRYKADGYDPQTNTVYFFHGIFWHGHPDFYDSDDIHPVTGTTFGELYENTKLMEKRITSLGYHLEVIWEHDWDKLGIK